MQPDKSSLLVIIKPSTSYLLFLFSGKSKRLSLKENSAEEEESKISEMSELSDTRGRRKEAKKKRSKSIKITLDIDPLEGKVTPVKKERKKKSGARSNSHGADLTHHSDINEGQTT